MMKGQVNIEFVISVSIFTATIIYASFVIINTIPAYHGRNQMEIIKGNTYQISQHLLFNNLTVPQERYNLSNRSVDTFCSDYKKTINSFGLGNQSLIVDITNLTKTIRGECKPPIVSEVLKTATIYRYAILNKTNEIIRLKISVQ